MDYLRTLCYKQRPDYCGIESAFIQMMDAREVNIDEPMDWEPVYIKRPGEVVVGGNFKKFFIQFLEKQTKSYANWAKGGNREYSRISRITK